MPAVCTHHHRALVLLTLSLFLARCPARVASAQAAAHPSFELLTHRMDVDVDGAPNAYGPAGKPTLDVLKDAHYRGRRHGEIVGYLTDDDDPRIPILQGPHDPYPGYYISQTSFTDPARTDPRDPLRYVNAAAINYIVLGDKARHLGARVGDFASVYSRRTHRSVFALVADEGNPTGDEGSLHLLQDLGYPFQDGKNDAIEDREIVIRFYPKSNPRHLFFHTQPELRQAATRLGLSRDFSRSPIAQSRHPKLVDPDV